MNQINIVTAQNVTLHIELANIGDRFLAAIIDLLIKFGAVFGFAILAGLAKDTEWAIYIIIFLLFVGFCFYSLLFETLMNGQTPGKRLMKIRVARLDGEQVTFGNYLLRWLFCIVDFFLTLMPTVGIFLIITTKWNQRLGDLVAGTILVSSKERTSLQKTFYRQIEPGYVTVFSRADQLTSREAEIIKQVLFLYETEDKYDLIPLLVERLKESLQIDTRMDDLAFLRTLIKDYNHSGSLAPGTSTTEEQAFSYQP